MCVKRIVQQILMFYWAAQNDLFVIKKGHNDFSTFQDALKIGKRALLNFEADRSSFISHVPSLCSHLCQVKAENYLETHTQSL